MDIIDRQSARARFTDSLIFGGIFQTLFLSPYRTQPNKACTGQKRVHYSQANSVKVAWAGLGHVAHVAVDFCRAGSYNVSMVLE